MPPDFWERIQSLFLQAADLPPEEQAHFLDSACAIEPGLRAEVESLLATDRKGLECLSSAIENEAALLIDTWGAGPSDAQNLSGNRLGPWRAVREIGHGGMGIVYLATRDDDHFHKRVAIKVVRRGMETAEELGRFRHERQILANLDHPYIARLLDGGATSDGRPFLVMDYVEGVPVDVFCREHSLGVRERLELFLRICEAVAHAHRNLVVHRDLKPGNIFVTADGTPRLLDFGVAKLLTGDSARDAATHTLAGFAFTPEYASPEQVRGGTVTTATDVYSLGAILYELLTGARAQPIQTNSPIEIDCAVCKTEVRKPSLTAPGLDADLDFIVLKAMRKEPEHRYASVDALAEDIRRHLDKQPVLAREGSLRYRGGKFVRRNRAAFGGGVVFAAVLIGGAAASAFQAQRADRERARAEDERRIAFANQRKAEQAALDAQAQRRQADLERALAETEQQTADRRFGQVRELAGKFLLDFHDAIATLPGATSARKMVVETGLRYYDTLVKEAKGNRALLEETARGYDRMGDVQGNPYYPNLGDSAGAMDSYEKARAIREKISDPSPQFLSDRMGGNERIAELQALKGDLAPAEGTLRRMIALGEHSPLSNARPVREALAHAYSDLSAMQFRTGAYEKAIEPASRLLELWTGMARENLDPVAERAGVSLAHTRLCDALVRVGRYDEALPHVRIASRIDKELVEASPNSATRLRKYYVDYSLLWLIFRNSPQTAAPGEAKLTAQTVADLGDRMQAADPTNSTALFDLMTAQSILGDWYRDNGEPEASVSHYQRAVDAIERFAATRKGELLSEDSVAFAHERLGSGLGNSGRLEEALEQFRLGDAALARAETRNPGLLQLVDRRADIAVVRGDAYARAKMWREASDAWAAGVALKEDLCRRAPENRVYRDDLIEMRVKLADGYANLEQLSKAVETMELAISALSDTALRRPLASKEADWRKAGAAKVALWKQQIAAKN
jgi:tetratricopeptide (TPR) repeat protein